jgi:hypothetical protein
MIGLIETMTESEATGWVKLPEGEAFAHIELYFNDKKILTFRTTHEVIRSGVDGKVGFFSLRFKSIWRYMSPKDKLVFLYNNNPLFISENGYSYSHDKERVTNSKVMFKKLEEGYIFNQKGYLRLSKTLDYDWQDNVVALYNRVGEFLKVRYGLELFVMSGTLLGAVREGEFIGHDHDFDVGLISKGRTGVEAKKESIEFSKDLINHGFKLQFKPSCTYISHPDYAGAQIDLVRMYFNENDLLCSAFGFATKTEFPLASYKGVDDWTISGHRVKVPAAPESYLEVIYGRDWKIPNPTFNWQRELKVRDKASRLSGAEIQELDDYAKHVM